MPPLYSNSNALRSSGNLGYGGDHLQAALDYRHVVIVATSNQQWLYCVAACPIKPDGVARTTRPKRF